MFKPKEDLYYFIMTTTDNRQRTLRKCKETLTFILIRSEAR